MSKSIIAFILLSTVCFAQQAEKQIQCKTVLMSKLPNHNKYTVIPNGTLKVINEMVEATNNEPFHFSYSFVDDNQIMHSGYYIFSTFYNGFDSRTFVNNYIVQHEFSNPFSGEVFQLDSKESAILLDNSIPEVDVLDFSENFYSMVRLINISQKNIKFNKVNVDAISTNCFVH